MNLSDFSFLLLVCGRLLVWGMLLWMLLLEWRNHKLWGQNIYVKTLLNAAAILYMVFCATTTVRTESIDIWRGYGAMLGAVVIASLVYVVWDTRRRLRFYIDFYIKATGNVVEEGDK